MKKGINKDIVKFDLERLKGKKVVVNCRTAEQFQSYINWVNSLGKDSYHYNPWKQCGEDSCVCLYMELTWRFCTKEYFKELNYEIISYEEALLKESNKQKKSKKSKSNKLKFPCFLSIPTGGEVVSCPNERWFLEVLKPIGFELATKDEVESYYYLGKD